MSICECVHMCMCIYIYIYIKQQQVLPGDLLQQEPRGPEDLQALALHSEPVLLYTILRTTLQYTIIYYNTIYTVPCYAML